MTITRSAPTRALRAQVEFFVQRKINGDRVELPVFPTARAEILFNFGDPFLVAADRPRFVAVADAAVLAPRAHLYWQVAGPRIDWFLIALTPAGCRQLLGKPLAALWRGDHRLDAFWPEHAAPLHAALSRAPCFAERVAIAVAVLETMSRNQPIDPVAALADEARTAPIGSIGSIASRLGMGSRQLRNRFHAELGVAPKLYFSLMRFNRHLAATHPKPWRRDDAASDAEYFDESHAHRDFKRFAGMTPGRYRREKADREDSLVFTGMAIKRS